MVAGFQVVVLASLCTVVGWIVAVPLMAMGTIRWMAASGSEEDPLSHIWDPTIPVLRQVGAFWLWWALDGIVHVTVMMGPVFLGLLLPKGTVDFDDPTVKMGITIGFLALMPLQYMVAQPLLRAPMAFALVEVAHGRTIGQALSATAVIWRESSWRLPAVLALLSPVVFYGRASERAADGLPDALLRSGIDVAVDPDLFAAALGIVALEAAVVPAALVTWAALVNAWSQVRDTTV